MFVGFFCIYYKRRQICMGYVNNILTRYEIQKGGKKIQNENPYKSHGQSLINNIIYLKVCLLGCFFSCNNRSIDMIFVTSIVFEMDINTSHTTHFLQYRKCLIRKYGVMWVMPEVWSSENMYLMDSTLVKCITIYSTLWPCVLI